MDTVFKINWERVARSAVRDDKYCRRLLDDIREETGKWHWTAPEVLDLWGRAKQCTDTWGEFTRSEISRWKECQTN